MHGLAMAHYTTPPASTDCECGLRSFGLTMARTTGAGGVPTAEVERARWYASRVCTTSSPPTDDAPYMVLLCAELAPRVTTPPAARAGPELIPLWMDRPPTDSKSAGERCSPGNSSGGAAILNNMQHTHTHIHTHNLA